MIPPAAWLSLDELHDDPVRFFPFITEQNNFYDQPTRLFFMKGKLFGLTVPGYHRYQDKSATMNVRLFGLFPVVRVAGAEAFERIRSRCSMTCA
jgi:hypothetical protein